MVAYKVVTLPPDFGRTIVKDIQSRSYIYAQINHNQDVQLHPKPKSNYYHTAICYHFFIKGLYFTMIGIREYAYSEELYFPRSQKHNGHLCRPVSKVGSHSEAFPCCRIQMKNVHNCMLESPALEKHQI